MSKLYFDNDLEFISVFKQLTRGESNRAAFDEKIVEFGQRLKDSEHPEKLVFWQTGREVNEEDDLSGMYVLLALHFDSVSKETHVISFDKNPFESESIDLDLFREQISLRVLPMGYKDIISDIKGMKPKWLSGEFQKTYKPLDDGTRCEKKKELNKYLQLAVEWVAKDRGIVPEQIGDEHRIKPGGEPTSIRIAKVIRKSSPMTSSTVAKLADTTAGTVRNSAAWNNRQKLWQTGKEVRKGSKDKDGTMEAHGTEADRPQAEHYDIYYMIQECKSSEERKEYPTTKQIAEKLTNTNSPVSEERAKELLKEAKSFFPDIS